MNVGTYCISNTDFLRDYSPERVHEFDSRRRYPYDVLIWNNNHDFHSRMLRSFPNLKLFINWGTDDVNLTDEETLRKKVEVRKGNFYAQQSICEYVLMLLVSFEHAQDKTHRGTARENSKQLYGKKIGLIGLGKIGFSVASFLQKSFWCSICYNAPKDYCIPNCSFAPVDELFRTCDYVIFAVKSKKCRINPKVLKRANPNLVILNISRDSVLPLEYIYPYVTEGKIRGFIGDVSENPTGKRPQKNILLARKSGYQTEEAIRTKRNIALFHLKQYRLREKGERSYVHIARHGKTEWNALKVYQGTCDSPLLPEGEMQAKRVAEMLAGNPIRHIFTSPLGRTMQTAKIISGRLNAPVLCVPAFREMHFGSFESKSKELMKEIFGDFFASRSQNAYHKLFVPYPGGESYYDVYLRILTSVLDLLVAHDDFLIVGHESVNRMIRGIISGKSLTDMVGIGQENNELVSIELGSNEENSVKV